MKLATRAVCPGHSAPVEFLLQQAIDRPDTMLWQGPRGGGKSFLSALGVWLDSQQYDHHGTRILGGSLAQSEQIYQAMRSFDRARPSRSPLASFGKRQATFTTGSEVAILAASPTSVRGPHVASLRLDEVDEIDEDIRESALGMNMELYGVPASVTMTSTWHRVGGPMASLVERGRAGEFPYHTFCAFEVLERCPDSRSGKALEHCPDCPLVRWCHADFTDGLPKAKRSDGHYAIDSLIQKLKILSPRVFASDYLCEEPRAAGVWFTQFDRSSNVSEEAEYRDGQVVHLAIDSGVYTGAVLMHVDDLGNGDAFVRVFDEYLSEGQTAESSALAILSLIRDRCGDRHRRRVSTDSAGGSRNPVGPTVLAEYQRVGLYGERGIEQWPNYAGSVADGLQLIEALVRSADGTVRLLVHPRCRRLIEAFSSYARAKRGGQWQDYPEDPQHPHEDLIDALRGGLKVAMPESRRPPPKLARIPAGRVI